MIIGYKEINKARKGSKNTKMFFIVILKYSKEDPIISEFLKNF
ncbi:MAG: hypothetical protein PWP39_796 [Pyrococcus sp.]|nr:hypothetical protein [Pyrococcus sp.]MDK2869561.1 hypothetical protein [Pyrococcus sp.]